MRSHILRILGINAVLALLLFSCRQPSDLDTDRTVVPINVPEITDFSPKAGYLGDTITIVGKNFVNVESVTILGLPSPMEFRVVNTNRIISILPVETPQITTAQVFRRGFLPLTVKAKLGTAYAPSDFLMLRGLISGRITLNNEPLDSADIFLTIPSKDLSGQADLKIYRQTIMPNFTNPRIGWYFVDNESFLLQASQYLEPGEVTIRPIRSGYGFKPIVQTIRTNGNRRLTIAQNFEAVITPPEQMPEVTSVVPTFGSSFSTSMTETGTDITLRGKGFTEVRKVFIGVTYSYSRLPISLIVSPFLNNLIFTEVSSIQILNDSQMTIRLPRLPHQIAVRGDQFNNCRILIVRDDTSLLASQRITIVSQ